MDEPFHFFSRSADDDDWDFDWNEERNAVNPKNENTPTNQKGEE